MLFNSGKKYILIFIGCMLISFSIAKKAKEGEKPAWAKKDIRDYNEADLERLLEQWEEDEEPLEDDELPEHLRPQPQIDFSKIKDQNPESLLKLSKKGRTLMTFVQVDSDATRDETEELTKFWQTSLWNNHIQAERYLVDDNRAIFLFKDGSQAWEAKDFLIDQTRCASVTVENKVYDGLRSKDKKSIPVAENKDEL
ncbi:LDLR chaperone boca isoform X2 [Nilaparvata lugens]|uniref:LDLR chaperone boca isoform X2 n=1 Tax=Nilaparvata lugens TaxID=108931 RepID=UPI000B98965B|nr:LDLR chaperone boca isoform X2 [Nilaparvata lugens]